MEENQVKTINNLNKINKVHIKRNFENDGKEINSKEIKIENEKGITLLTLAITILIIIILAGITINATLGDNGLLKQAQNAKDMAESTTLETGEKMNKILQEYANVMAEDETIENPGSGTEPEDPEEPEEPSTGGNTTGGETTPPEEPDTPETPTTPETRDKKKD